MIGSNLAAINSKSESSRTDIEQSGGICEVHPWSGLFVSLVGRNAMMAAQCSDSLSRPAVSASGKMTIPV